MRFDREKGRLVSRSAATVAQHLDDWLRVIEGDLRPATVADYPGVTVRRHLKPAFGRYKLQALTGADIALQFADSRATAGAYPASTCRTSIALIARWCSRGQWGRIG
ncbi:MAG: hypothetical protein U5Q44_00095 [Dehalococcoidia bacterium]|nr:hypothetical protein [Dehalococcoidia bacterium]